MLSPPPLPLTSSPIFRASSDGMVQTTASCVIVLERQPSNSREVSVDMDLADEDDMSRMSGFLLPNSRANFVTSCSSVMSIFARA